MDPARANVLVVVGASGSGKSSLLHAGLGPHLREQGHAITTFTPGRDPVHRLHAALDGRATGADDLPPVLLIDQFEELFTAGADEPQVAAFLDELEGRTAPGADGGIGAVLALRVDFYAELAGSDRLAGALEDAQVLVGPMTEAELTRAIAEPARRAGVVLEDELVALLLRDFVPTSSMVRQHDVGALPLLSHALLETYRRANGRAMSVADYEAAGGSAARSSARRRRYSLVATRASRR